MHRCPACDYELGPLPGVPAEPFGAFTAEVRCPECAFEVPTGARVLSGSTTEVGAQALTGRRRLWQITIAVAPQLFLLQMGIEALVSMSRSGFANARPVEFLKASCLLMVGVVAWAAWRRWTPKGDGDRRAPASFDVQWMSRDGALDVFGSMPGPRAAVAAVPGTRVVHPAADIRAIRVHCPARRGQKWRRGDRPVVQLVAEVWRRDRDGRRSDLFQQVIHVDCGAEPGPPGTDRTRAIVEAGDRIAAGLRRSIGLAGEEVPADGASTERRAERGTPALTIDGSLLALPPWPAQATGITLVLGIPLIAALGAVMFWMVVAISRWSAPRPLGPTPGFDAAGLVGAVTLVVLFPLWRWLINRARRRSMAKCRWEVAGTGIRVTELHCTLKGEPAGEVVRDIPGDHVAKVELVPRNGRLRIVATDRSGSELAGVTLDGIPDGGAEALAQQVREALASGSHGAPAA